MGLLTAIPYSFRGHVAMVILGRSSDRSGKRRLHFSLASLLGAVGIVVSNLFRQNTLIAMVGLSIATLGILATFPLFWPMPTAMLAGTPLPRVSPRSIPWAIWPAFSYPRSLAGSRSDKAKRLRPLRSRRGAGAWFNFGFTFVRENSVQE